MLLLVAPLLAANLRNGLVSDRLQMGGGQAEDTVRARPTILTLHQVATSADVRCRHCRTDCRNE